MKTFRFLALTFAIPALALALSMSGCEKKAETPAKPAAKGDGHDHKAGDGHDHKDGDDHDHKDGHDHEEGDGHDHAKPAAGGANPAAAAPAGKAGGDHGHGEGGAIGTATIGAWTVSVSGEIKAGSEAHLDIKLSGSPAKPAAVRVWIGSQDGKGAMKHKADGDGKEYHAHADVPNPIPAGAQLWVEIDDGKGSKSVCGFPISK